MKVAQSCLTLCNPLNCSQPDSSVHGILQTRILEWIAVPFSRESFQPRDRTQVSTLQADPLLSEPPGKPNDCPSLPLISKPNPFQRTNEIGREISIPTLSLDLVSALGFPSLISRWEEVTSQGSLPVGLGTTRTI